MNKTKLLSIIFCAAAVGIIEPRAYAPDVYTAVAIPKEFQLPERQNCLNNKGVVVGSIYPKQEQVLEETKKSGGGNPINDQYEGAQASYWSEKSGLVSLNLKSYENFGYRINDNGFVVGVSYESKTDQANREGRVMAWDTNINQVKIGPAGQVGAVDDKNDVLFGEFRSNKSHVWNIKENSVEFSSRLLIDSPEWKPYHNYSAPQGIYFNKKLNSVKITQHDIYLVFEGKNKLLLPTNGTIYRPQQIPPAWLNDNDEVIALTYVESPTEKIYNAPKRIFSITKWRSDGMATTSEPISNIPALNNYQGFEIKGFNNLGQVLISTGQPRKPVGNLFLLNPAAGN